MLARVAIILVNWNGYAMTKDCIESILANAAPPINTNTPLNQQDLFENNSTPVFKIVVVDNGSTDGSAEKLRHAFPQVHLIASTENLGFTGGNNLGMTWAIEQGFEYSFLLNNDTFVGPGFLEPLLNYMDAHPQTGAVQPRICFAHDRARIWNAGTAYHPWWGVTTTKGFNQIDGPQFAQAMPLDWITGCAFFIRNQVLTQIGLFDPAFFTYYEDVDLSFRIKKAGYRLHYLPVSVIYHIAGMSGKTIAKGKEGFLHASVHYHNVRNRIWIWRRYAQIWQWPSILAYHLFYFGGMLLYFLLRGRLNKFDATCKGLRDGFLK